MSGDKSIAATAAAAARASVRQCGKNALAHPQRRRIGVGRGFGDKLQRWGMNPAQVSLCGFFFLLYLHLLLHPLRYR